MVKIVPSTPDTYPPLESAKLAFEFAIVARQDARAAKLLYRNRLYGLSAFHVQQAVEKATKAIALLMGFVEPTPDNLVIGVGHDTILGVTTSFPDFVEATVKQWDELTTKMNDNADFDKALTIIDGILMALKEAYIHGRGPEGSPEEGGGNENFHCNERAVCPDGRRP